MCGIVACRTSGAALDYLVPALSRLEYRGYDSAGIAVHSDVGNVRIRAVGRLEALQRRLGAYAGPPLNGSGIGHTRWATHGAVTEDNAHPHIDCTGRLSIVHNGIIDNAAELRQQLTAAGHVFRSDVDSEVIAHVVEDYRATEKSLVEAVRATVARLCGSWALAVLADGVDRVVVSAHDSPLIVASGPLGEFAASDLSALLEWSGDARALGDGDVVELGQTQRWIRADGSSTAPEPLRADWTSTDTELGTHRDFMEKEIGEQAEMAARLLDRLRPGIGNGALWADRGLPPLERIRVLACGTSLHAGMAVGRVFRAVGGIPVRLTIASEAAEDAVENHEVVLAFSQSGETADVLRALQLTRTPVLAITNTMHSTLARRADAVVGCYAGPEVGVAATKTFTAQVLAGVCVALSGLVRCDLLAGSDLRRLLGELDRIPESLANAHRGAVQVADLCSTLTEPTGFLFVARGAGIPYAAEGALKLKEITYRWAQSYPAGELKHGPIALIERGTPVVVVDDGNRRLDGNIAEMQARGAHIIRVSEHGLTAGPGESTPWGPLPAVITLQHFARSLAIELGRDVDKPRNLAKSVTVE